MSKKNVNDGKINSYSLKTEFEGKKYQDRKSAFVDLYIHIVKNCNEIQQKKFLFVYIYFTNELDVDLIKIWIEIYEKICTDTPNLTLQRNNILKFIELVSVINPILLNQYIIQIYGIILKYSGLDNGETTGKILTFNRNSSMRKSNKNLRSTLDPYIGLTIKTSLSDYNQTNICLDSFDSKEIATELTGLSDIVYKNIHPHEFINKSKKNGQESFYPNLSKFIEQSNNFYLWTGFQILKKKDSDNRQKTYEKFIDIAFHCLLLNNFHMAYSIYSGLTCNNVTRLDLKITDKKKEKMRKMCEIFSTEKNYKNYHTEIDKIKNKKPFIHHLGIITKTVEFYFEKKIFIENNINLDFYDTFSDYILDYFESTKSKLYKFEENKKITDLLNNMEIFTEQTLDSLSENIKPLKNPLDSKDFKTWTKYDVETWLTNIGLINYATKFINEDIIGEYLPFLKEERLESCLGIEKYSDRLKIISEINKLKKKK